MLNNSRTAVLPALILGILAMTLGLCTTHAQAQGRKAPPPQAERYEPEPPDIELWRDAYDDFEAPEIMVMCGWSSGRPRAAAGESSYFNLDESPFAVQLQGAFIDVINDPRADVYLVDAGAIRDAIRRLQNNLLNNTEHAAMRLLANEVNAGMVIQIQLIDRRSNDTPNRVRFQTIDVSNGRTLTTKVFDWKLGNSTRDVKTYAEQIARLFINDIAARTQNPAKFNLRLFGPMRDARLARDIKRRIDEIRGVSRVRARTASTERHPVTGAVEALSRYTVTYSGDFMDLSAEVTDALATLDDVDVRIFEAAGNQLSLNVTPVVEEPDEEEEEEQNEASATTFKGCLDLLLDPTFRGERFRDELQILYRKQDSPSIAVLVNRDPSAEDRAENAPAAGGSTTSADTIVMINSAGRDVDNSRPGAGAGGTPQRDDGEGPSRITQLERQTNLVESALFKRLGPELLSFERKDASTARSRLVKHIEKQTDVYDQRELVKVLRQHNIADIVIFGSGADLPESDGRMSVTYTFRAIQISDAGVLGVASAREILDTRSEHDIVEAIADSAIKDLVCEMKQSWSPPNELDLTISNMNNSDDLDLFLQTVTTLESGGEGINPLEIVGRTGFEGAEGQGTAMVTVRYLCQFNELFQVFRELAGQLPYDLDIQSFDPSQAKLAIVR